MIIHYPSGLRKPAIQSVEDPPSRYNVPVARACKMGIYTALVLVGAVRVRLRVVVVEIGVYIPDLIA